jgi:hypothetical protein
MSSWNCLQFKLGTAFRTGLLSRGSKAKEPRSRARIRFAVDSTISISLLTGDQGASRIGLTSRSKATARAIWAGGRADIFWDVKEGAQCSPFPIGALQACDPRNSV